MQRASLRGGGKRYGSNLDAFHHLRAALCARSNFFVGKKGGDFIPASAEKGAPGEEESKCKGERNTQRRGPGILNSFAQQKRGGGSPIATNGFGASVSKCLGFSYEIEALEKIKKGKKIFSPECFVYAKKDHSRPMGPAASPLPSFI